MTEYDKNVHAFGLRWLTEHPLAFDFRTFDPMGQITLYETHDDGYDPTYSYGPEHHEIGLVVPTYSGETRICLQEGEEMNFGSILQAIVAEAHRPAMTPLELAETQVKTLTARCDALESQLFGGGQATLALEKEIGALKSGMRQQTELWKMLQMVHRELDLWFNAAAPAVLKLNVTKTAVSE